MLNCQSCQTRLVLYSSQLDHSLQQLQESLAEDTDNLIPDAIKADFLIQKQLRNITPDVYIIPDGQPGAGNAVAMIGSNNSGTFTANNNISNNNITINPNPSNENINSSLTSIPSIPTSSNTNPNFIQGLLTRQTESNQALIPTDGSLSFPVIEQRISKVSHLLSLLTNLTLIHNPLCPKCCHELNMKLTQYCTKLDSQLESLLTTQCDLLQISFKNDIAKARERAGASLAPLTPDQRITQLLDQQLYQADNFPSQSSTPQKTSPHIHHHHHHSPSGMFAVNGINNDQMQTFQSQDELLNQQMLALYNEEQALREELIALDDELYLLHEEENELVQFTGYLSQLEDNFMSTFLDMKQAISQYLLLTRTIKTKLDQQQTIHNALSLTSPIFDLMTIDLQSPIPSISGFRLGRSDDYPVDWFEINAGFGQMCLLLDILRRTFALTFKDDISLYPVGHRSYISKHGEISPLFRESNDHIKTQQFNRGLAVMLQCIQELYESQMFFITPIPSSIVMASGSGDISSSTTDTNGDLNASSTTTNSTNNTSTRRQRDLAAGYQPQLHYQHQLPLLTNPNDNQGSTTLYQQPQYDTAQYAQLIAKSGLPVAHMMSTQIQPPQIVCDDPSITNNNNNNTKEHNNGPTSVAGAAAAGLVSGAAKIASLPGVALSAVAPQAVFICSINGTQLNCESPSLWVNAMRHVLMALFQLMLLAVQRGV